MNRGKTRILIIILLLTLPGVLGEVNIEQVSIGELIITQPNPAFFGCIGVNLSVNNKSYVTSFLECLDFIL